MQPPPSWLPTGQAVDLNETMEWFECQHQGWGSPDPEQRAAFDVARFKGQRILHVTFYLLVHPCA